MSLRLRHVREGPARAAAFREWTVRAPVTLPDRHLPRFDFCMKISSYNVAEPFLPVEKHAELSRIKH